MTKILRQSQAKVVSELDGPPEPQEEAKGCFGLQAADVTEVVANCSSEEDENEVRFLSG